MIILHTNREPIFNPTFNEHNEQLYEFWNIIVMKHATGHF